MPLTDYLLAAAFVAALCVCLRIAYTRGVADERRRLDGLAQALESRRARELAKLAALGWN